MPNRAERDAITIASASEAANAKVEADAIAHRAVVAKDVDELRAAVVVLAGRVSSLSEALTAVNEIQRRQTLTERQTTEIKKQALATKQTTETLAATSVTKDTLAETTAIQKQQTLEFRKNTLIRVYSTGILLVLFILAITTGIVAYQADKVRSEHIICAARNQQNGIIINILEGSIKGIDPNQPHVQNILTGIKEFKNLQQDCGKL